MFQTCTELALSQFMTLVHTGWDNSRDDMGITMCPDNVYAYTRIKLWKFNCEIVNE